MGKTDVAIVQEQCEGIPALQHKLDHLPVTAEGNIGAVAIKTRGGQHMGVINRDPLRFLDGGDVAVR